MMTCWKITHKGKKINIYCSVYLKGANLFLRKAVIEGFPSPFFLKYLSVVNQNVKMNRSFVLFLLIHFLNLNMHRWICFKINFWAKVYLQTNSVDGCSRISAMV